MLMNRCPKRPRILKGGRAHVHGRRPWEFDEKELEKGIEVEMEHTNDRDIAMFIAMDHLDEFPDYYTRLAKMEREARKHWRGRT
jgi:hypothetical protein